MSMNLCRTRVLSLTCTYSVFSLTCVPLLSSFQSKLSHATTAWRQREEKEPKAKSITQHLQMHNDNNSHNRQSAHMSEWMAISRVETESKVAYMQNGECRSSSSLLSSRSLLSLFSLGTNTRQEPFSFCYFFYPFLFFHL